MLSTSVIADLCIYILTWNVGGHSPKDISLKDALTLNGTNRCPYSDLPDIYVLGFQRVNTNPIIQLANLFHYDNEWTSKIREELSQYDYDPLETEQMQGILLSVWAKRAHVPYIRDIETKNTGTGILDYWGNKGAVGVRLSLYGTAVTFIVAHLASGDENLDERVKDYKEIVENHRYQSKGYETIFDHDVVFWFGDLNFRLNDLAWNHHIISKNDRSSHFALDELTMVRKSGEAFDSMDEVLPLFPPTYKFVTGTSNYDPEQRPAWCDRVLYKINKYQNARFEPNLQLTSYRSHPGYTLSTHKPVSAEFLYTIKEIAADASEERFRSQISIIG